MTAFALISVGIPELILVLVIVLIIFGPGKLPKIGKALGEALGGFKKAANAKFDEDEKTKKKEEDNESTGH
ncbi:twin-arginine translocase TatA/TatE family subunit [Thermincola potens]|uniref:Sec-independent protein translocase protein TatA n=1 Tax=Thermincola potens (strain JR) TaxID=635013 RepID=D5X7P8_THEPJ|nr:twin-arginine translocase TatA/TatE family subunit [Thermincola potens]ADG82618.1 twin-arginine translocation protein, TatA/E family subunit [Thermincola potens JR]